MPTTLRALIVEDVEHDAVRVVRELRRGGYDVVSERVETGGAFTTRARELLDQVKTPCAEKPFETSRIRAIVEEMLR